MRKYFIALSLLMAVTSCGKVDIPFIPDFRPLPAVEATDDTPYAHTLNHHTVKTIRNKIEDEPNTIYALTANQVINLLGSPILIRNTSNTEVWQFKGECILNIVWDKSGTVAKKSTLLSLEDKEQEITSPAETSDSNYAIVWLEGLRGNKQKVKGTSCFITLMSAR